MSTIEEVKREIKSYPDSGIRAHHSDGEWRVFITRNKLSELYPNATKDWLMDKQEAMAYYTDDSDDALATARLMYNEVERSLSPSIKADTQFRSSHQEVYEYSIAFDEDFGKRLELLEDWSFNPHRELVPHEDKFVNKIFLPIAEVPRLRSFQIENPEKWGSHPLVKMNEPPAKQLESLVGQIQSVSSNQNPKNEIIKDATVMAKSDFFELNIRETGNAAFVDVGRNEEIGRIIQDAANVVEESYDLDGFEANLRDLNGNRVGDMKTVLNRSEGDVGEGALRLTIETGNASFGDEKQLEIANILRAAAAKIRNNDLASDLYDTNGNSVGSYEFVQEPSLVKNGTGDMKEVLDQNLVYIVDEAISDLDNEYRFVITTPGFEPNYGYMEGDVWLVNAKGEVDDGSDLPRTVHESSFRELMASERNDLIAVANGEKSFEDFERNFLSDDPELV